MSMKTEGGAAQRALSSDTGRSGAQLTAINTAAAAATRPARLRAIRVEAFMPTRYQRPAGTMRAA